MTSLSDWRLDLATGRDLVHRGGDSSLNPPGFALNVNVGQHHGDTDSPSDQQEALARKRAWDVALGPLKSIPMNMFMMYMAGRTVSIFPIMMVAMAVWRPAKALFTVNATFKSLETDETTSLLLNKIVFVIGNIGVIAIAIYKIHTMGLLPNMPSDWLEFVPPVTRLQYAFVGESYV